MIKHESIKRHEVSIGWEDIREWAARDGLYLPSRVCVDGKDGLRDRVEIVMPDGQGASPKIIVVWTDGRVVESRDAVIHVDQQKG